MSCFVCLNRNGASIQDAKISKEQLGFQKGKNIADGSMLIELTIEEITRRKDTGIIASFDFMKAFDSVEHHHIMNCLKKWTSLNHSQMQLLA